MEFIHGIQGEDEVMKAAACAKHFAVHSGPEDIRHEFDARVSKKLTCGKHIFPLLKCV